MPLKGELPDMEWVKANLMLNSGGGLKVYLPLLQHAFGFGLQPTMAEAWFKMNSCNALKPIEGLVMVSQMLNNGEVAKPVKLTGKPRSMQYIARAIGTTEGEFWENDTECPFEAERKHPGL